jgi:hypothetical protein
VVEGAAPAALIGLRADLLAYVEAHAGRGVVAEEQSQSQSLSQSQS